MVRPLRLKLKPEEDCRLTDGFYFKERCFTSEKDLIDYKRSLGSELKENWSEVFLDLTFKDAENKCNSLGMSLPSNEELKLAKERSLLNTWIQGLYWSSRENDMDSFHISYYEELRYKKIETKGGRRTNSNTEIIDKLINNRVVRNVICLQKTAIEINNDKLNIPQAQLEETSKKVTEEPEALRKMRMTMEKEIDTNPYQFEVSCYSSIDDVRLELEQCGSKLKPTLKVTSRKKIIYNFTYLDFLNGTFNLNYRLPKEFHFELTSASQDDSKLLVVTMKERLLKDDPNTGKIIYGVGKMYAKMGHNLIIVP